MSLLHGAGRRSAQGLRVHRQRGVTSRTRRSTSTRSCVDHRRLRSARRRRRRGQQRRRRGDRACLLLSRECKCEIDRSDTLRSGVLQFAIRIECGDEYGEQNLDCRLFALGLLCRSGAAGSSGTEAAQVRVVTARSRSGRRRPCSHSGSRRDESCSNCCARERTGWRSGHTMRQLRGVQVLLWSPRSDVHELRFGLLLSLLSGSGDGGCFSNVVG